MFNDALVFVLWLCHSDDDGFLLEFAVRSSAKQGTSQLFDVFMKECTGEAA